MKENLFLSHTLAGWDFVALLRNLGDVRRKNRDMADKSRLKKQIKTVTCFAFSPTENAVLGIVSRTQSEML